MDSFTQKGYFTVGVPMETIRSLLGEPREQVKLTKRNRWVYAHWGVDFENERVGEIVNLVGATNELYQPTEKVVTDLGGETWLPGLRRKTKGKAMAMYFVPGETIATHTQKVTVERLLGLIEKAPLKTITERLMEIEKKDFPGATHKILKGDDQTVYIAAKIPVAGTFRHELTRLFAGPKDLHRLKFTLISKEDPTQEFQLKWFGIFQAAELKKVGK